MNLDSFGQLYDSQFCVDPVGVFLWTQWIQCANQLSSLHVKMITFGRHYHSLNMLWFGDLISNVSFLEMVRVCTPPNHLNVADAIQKSTTIKRLNLIGVEFVGFPRAISNNKSLREIAFQGSSIDDCMMRSILSNTTVDKIDFLNCSLSFDGLQEEFSNSQISTWKITSSTFNGASHKTLFSGLKSNNNVIHLSIHIDYAASEESRNDLVEFVRDSTSLRELDMCCDRETEQRVLAINPHVEKMVFTLYGDTSMEFAKFISSTKTVKEMKIIIHFDVGIDAYRELLNALGKNTSLKTLISPGINLGRDWLSLFGKCLHENSTLEKVSVYFYNIHVFDRQCIFDLSMGVIVNASLMSFTVTSTTRPYFCPMIDTLGSMNMFPDNKGILSYAFLVFLEYGVHHPVANLGLIYLFMRLKDSVSTSFFKKRGR